jgi:O-antigen ligase
MNKVYSGYARSKHAVRNMRAPIVQAFVEYSYYGLLCYGLLGEAWGLSIPLLAFAGLIGLAMYCIWRLISHSSGTSLNTILLPIGCAVSFTFIQMVFYGLPVTDDAVRPVIIWGLTLVIVCTLCLREGFFHRFVLATLIIGGLSLPFLNFGYLNDPLLQRVGLDTSIGLANPNDLAAWFGFCCVYYGIVAIETRRKNFRLRSSVIALGCLFVVGLTVSRGALMAVAIAGTVAARNRLKRGFLPILLMLILGSGLFISGIFDQAIGRYEERGTEETGRLLVWPPAIQRFLNSPILGVGAANSATYVPAMGREVTPHNSFLYIGLSAGIVPLVFFAAYWITAAKQAYRANEQRHTEAPFQAPLLIYTFIIASLGAGQFMFSWAVVTLTMITSPFASRPTDVVAQQIRNYRVAHSLRRRTRLSVPTLKADSAFRPRAPKSGH